MKITYYKHEFELKKGTIIATNGIRWYLPNHKIKVYTTTGSFSYLGVEICFPLTAKVVKELKTKVLMKKANNIKDDFEIMEYYHYLGDDYNGN
jgi:hypothetical protein